VSGLARVSLFAGLLVLVFAAAALAGSAIDPDPDRDKSTSAHSEKPEKAAGEGGHSTPNSGEAKGTAHAKEPAHAKGPAEAKGLAQAQGGLRLVLDQPEDVATSKQLAFRIVRANGDTVRDFDVKHDRRMHLIVVRRDLSGFQHLHPKQTADGGWQVPLRLADAGSYRVFADFSTGGESRTLGGDLHKDGTFVARELPHPASIARTESGYEVRLQEKGDQVRFTVFKDGRLIEDIEPYLGARGHLVALREGDLAFLHVHPESRASTGSDIRFAVEYPSKGRYRLFLQFKVDGKVHTAAFTREVGDVHGH
jgi:hypothetical protein